MAVEVKADDVTDLLFYQYTAHVQPQTRQSDANTQNSSKLQHATTVTALYT